MTIGENIDIMRDIENAGKLPYTGIINNTNLGRDTTEETVISSLKKAHDLSQASNLPLLYTAIADTVPVKGVNTDVFDIQIHTKSYW